MRQRHEQLHWLKRDSNLLLSFTLVTERKSLASIPPAHELLTCSSGASVASASLASFVSLLEKIDETRA